jgi:hypothetical protein
MPDSICKNSDLDIYFVFSDWEQFEFFFYIKRLRKFNEPQGLQMSQMLINKVKFWEIFLNQTVHFKQQTKQRK